MLEGVFQVVKKYWKRITLVFLATLYDSGSTIIALSKPGTAEMNPVVEAFIIGQTSMTNILYVSALPLTALAVGVVLWARSSNPRMFEVFFEALIVIQTVAGINNTLVYLGKGTPYTMLLLAALIGSYLTRLYLIWKLSETERKLLGKLPSQPI